MSVREGEAAGAMVVEAGQIVQAWLRRLLEMKLIRIQAILTSDSGYVCAWQNYLMADSRFSLSESAKPDLSPL